MKAELPSESHRTADSGVSETGGKVTTANSTDTSQDADRKLTEHTDSKNISPVVYVLAASVIAGGITMIIIAVKRRK